MWLPEKLSETAAMKQVTAEAIERGEFGFRQGVKIAGRYMLTPRTFFFYRNRCREKIRVKPLKSLQYGSSVPFLSEILCFRLWNFAMSDKAGDCDQLTKHSEL